MPTRLIHALSILVLLSGCTLSAARYSDTQAKHLGFERSVIAGADFQHVIYRHRRSSDAGILHVYIEGDGSPWVGGRWVSSDPGPRRPLMLELMALDTTPSIYLGRPCYHGLHKQTPCSPIFWTHGRYSLPVLDSMARALDTVGAETHPEQIVLIGYSGGGALAMLLAERVPKVSAVVTIAGNLDPDRWARHHDYTPLSTSLNPARRKPLPSRVYQLHIAAEDDSVVPPEMVLEAVTRQRAPDVRVVPGIDHVCCWHALWPSLLTALSARLESEPGGH